MFSYNRDLNIVRKKNSCIHPLTDHENDLCFLEAIFIDSPYPHQTFTFAFWKSMAKYGLRKSAMRHLISLNELGGTLVSFTHPSERHQDMEQSSEDSLDEILYKYLSLDLDALRQKKVRILAEIHEQVDLGVVVDILTGLRALIVCDSGFIPNDISPCVVDPESRTIVPIGQIGEIWIRTSNCLAESLYKLPTLSKEIFENYLTLSDASEVANNYSFCTNIYTEDFPLLDRNAPLQNSSIYQSDKLTKYTRTGLVGFLLPDKTSHNSNLSINSNQKIQHKNRLFVVCLLKDVATYTCAAPRDSDDKDVITSSSHNSSYTSTENNLEEQALILNNVSSDFSMWSFPYINAISISPIQIKNKCFMNIYVSVTLEKNFINKLVKCMIKNIKHFLGPDVLLVSVFEKDVICSSTFYDEKSCTNKPTSKLHELKTLFSGYDSGISTIAKLKKISTDRFNNQKKHEHEFINTIRMDVKSIKLKIRKNLLAPSLVHLNIGALTSMMSNLSKRKELQNVMITPASLSDYPTNDLASSLHTCSQISYLPEQGSESDNAYNGIFNTHSYSSVLVNFDNITDLLVARCRAQGSRRALVLFDENMVEEKEKTYSNIGLNVGSIAHYLTDRLSLVKGTRVIIASSCSYGLFLALHACLYADIVPVILPPPEVPFTPSNFHIWTVAIVKFNIGYIMVDNKSEAIVKNFLHKLVVEPCMESFINTISSKIGPFEFPLRVINTNYLSKVGKSYYSGNLSFSRSNLRHPAFQPSKKDIPQIWTTLCDRNLKSGSRDSYSFSRDSLIEEVKQVEDSSGNKHPPAVILVYSDTSVYGSFVYLSHKALLNQCSRLARCFINQHINDDYRRSESLFSYFFNPISVKSIKPGSLKVKREFSDKINNKISVIGCHYRGLGFLYCTLIGIYTGIEIALIPNVKYEDTITLIYHYYSQNEVISTFVRKRYLKATAEKWTMDSELFRSCKLLNKNFVISCDTLNSEASVEQIDSYLSKSILSQNKIYIAWESPINPILSLQDVSQSSRVYLRFKSADIHNNILTVTGVRRNAEKLSSFTSGMNSSEIMLVDRGQPVEGSAVIVRDPVTKRIQPFGFVGEIWIGSESNASVSSRLTPNGKLNNSLKNNTPLESDLFVYHNKKIFIKRTNLHGFLWPVIKDGYVKELDPISGETRKNMGTETLDASDLSHINTSSTKRSDLYNSPNNSNCSTSIRNDKYGIITFGVSELEMKSASLFIVASTDDRILINGVYYMLRILESVIEEAYRGPMAGKCVVISIKPRSEPFILLLGVWLFGTETASTTSNSEFEIQCSDTRDARKSISMFALNSATRVIKTLLYNYAICPSMIAFVPMGAISGNGKPVDHRVSLKRAYLCGDLPIYHLICIKDIPECRPGNRVSYCRRFCT